MVIPLSDMTPYIHHCDIKIICGLKYLYDVNGVLSLKNDSIEQRVEIRNVTHIAIGESLYCLSHNSKQL
jgi:hypothetical protein